MNFEYIFPSTVVFLSSITYTENALGRKILTGVLDNNLFHQQILYI